MKLKERISWLMGTVQQSLFPHLDECLPVPLTEREKHLVKILEVGKNYPTIDRLEKIAEALNVPLMDFFDFMHLDSPDARALKLMKR